MLNLDGIHGLTGYQWLFIMGEPSLAEPFGSTSSPTQPLADGIISLPIAIAGFFILPDTPDRPNRRAKWLRPQDIALGRERMARIKRVEQVGFSPRSFIQSFSSWVPWVFAPMYVCFVLGLGSFACESRRSMACREPLAHSLFPLQT